MQTHFIRWHAQTLPWHSIVLESLLVVFLLVFLVLSPAVSAMRLQERSIYVNSSSAGAETFYIVSWRYMSPDPVGSVELLFCDDPIPYRPCNIPDGMDVSAATLSDQLGESGFAISNISTNRVVLTRIPIAPTAAKSSYRFDGIINPTTSDTAFAVRLKTFASTDASGAQIDFGSMRAQITEPVEISAQVPPILIFCMARMVSENCVTSDEVYYTDMGELSANSTLTAQSQMAIGTNASAGFVIAAHAAPLSAGTNIIEPLNEPTPSRQGVDQFGINLVANQSPQIGNDPEGVWANAVASPDYEQPNRYKFRSGDVVAYSSNVSLMKKFTVSYIVNSSASLRAGVYTTTVNYIASGRF